MASESISPCKRVENRMVEAENTIYARGSLLHKPHKMIRLDNKIRYIKNHATQQVPLRRITSLILGKAIFERSLQAISR